jgi:hypothetical protein
MVFPNYHTPSQITYSFFNARSMDFSMADTMAVVFAWSNGI